MKRYVQGVNCVVVGEIGLYHVRVRQDKGRDQNAEVFHGFVNWRKRSVSPRSFTVDEQQHCEGVFVDHEEQPPEGPNGVLAPLQ